HRLRIPLEVQAVLEDVLDEGPRVQVPRGQLIQELEALDLPDRRGGGFPHRTAVRPLVVRARHRASPVRSTRWLTGPCEPSGVRDSCQSAPEAIARPR